MSSVLFEPHWTYWITVPHVKTRDCNDIVVLIFFVEKVQIKYSINSEQLPFDREFKYIIAPCQDSVFWKSLSVTEFHTKLFSETYEKGNNTNE